MKGLCIGNKYNDLKLKSRSVSTDKGIGFIRDFDSLCFSLKIARSSASCFLTGFAYFYPCLGKNESNIPTL